MPKNVAPFPAIVTERGAGVTSGGSDESAVVTAGRSSGRAGGVECRDACPTGDNDGVARDDDGGRTGRESAGGRAAPDRGPDRGRELVTQAALDPCDVEVIEALACRRHQPEQDRPVGDVGDHVADVPTRAGRHRDTMVLHRERVEPHRQLVEPRHPIEMRRSNGILHPDSLALFAEGNRAQGYRRRLWCRSRPSVRVAGIGTISMRW